MSQQRTRRADDWVTPLLERISEWSAGVHVLLSGSLLAGFFWCYSKQWMIFALLTFLSGMIFAYWGIMALVRDWLYFRAIEQFVGGKADHRHRDMERLISGIFHHNGYKVQPAGPVLSAQNVDLIATKKKQQVFIQFNHWNDKILTPHHVDELHKTAIAYHADAVLIAFGTHTDAATELARLKEVSVFSREGLENFVRSLFYKGSAGIE